VTCQAGLKIDGKPCILDVVKNAGRYFLGALDGKFLLVYRDHEGHGWIADAPIEKMGFRKSNPIFPLPEDFLSLGITWRRAEDGAAPKDFDLSGFPY
jgi:hypothetical protein